MRTAVEIASEHESTTLQAIEIHKGNKWAGGSTSITPRSESYIVLASEGGGDMMTGSSRQSKYNMLTFAEYMASNFNPATDNDDKIDVYAPDDVSFYAVQLIEAARGLRWRTGAKTITPPHHDKYICISSYLAHSGEAYYINYSTSFKDYLTSRLTNNSIKRKTPYDSVLPGNAENWRTVEAIECLKGRKWISGEIRVAFQGRDRCIGLCRSDMIQCGVGSYEKTMSFKQYLNYNKAYVKQLEEMEANKPIVGTPERAIFDVQDVFPEHLRFSKDLQVKPVVFDLKDELSSDYDISGILIIVAKILHDLIKSKCPLLSGTLIPHSQLRDKFYLAFINNNLEKSFFQNYYTEGGAKITKRLKGIIKGVISKELTDHIFPVFCNKLSALYAKQETIIAFFGDKESLGEGLFEDGPTCFRRNKGSKGENAINGVFLDKNKRFQMLCLYSLEKQAFARVVVHFVGGRKVDMFNFYYQGGFKQNKRLFVEAYRRLFNLKKVTLAPGKTINVPIYCNDDHLVISTNRTHISTHKHKWVCPHCDGKAHPEDFHIRQRDYWRDLGCRESCLKLAAGKKCCVCEETISDPWTNNDGGNYCTDCYDDRYFQCYGCDSEASIDDIVGVGGYYYCESCASRCEECEYDYLNNELEGGLCEDCQNKLDEEGEKENEAA